ncbi:hypothetical protein BK704_35265 [[Bacillus thuringiensis] serovar konkukian]|nr:hypothetical protein [Bacillus thuringiensis]MED1304084.1 hypothetical protein [Bacillus pacificus]OUA91370.1 hypothetical protein BK704_35265 [[Bacillus thuringiensis] serovar konkukian]
MPPYTGVESSNYQLSHAGLVVFICSLVLAVFCAKQKDWRTCFLLLLVGLTGITSFYAKEIMGLGS